MTVKCKGLRGATGNVSRDGLGSDLSLSYDVWDPDADPDADGYFDSLFNKVVDTAPDTLIGLLRSNITFREDSEGSSHYIFDVSYKATTPGESLIRWSWDTTGGTVLLRASRETILRKSNNPSAPPPNVNGAIGVKGAEVEGVEVVTPLLKLTATYRHLQAGSEVNDDTIAAYVKKLARMTGRINDAEWQTYQRGELLFLGSTGEYVPGKDTEIQYHFAASENVTGLTIGDITDISKAGHDYLWIAFKASNVSGELVPKPKWVYVERVYELDDFTELGIG